MRKCPEEGHPIGRAQGITRSDDDHHQQLRPDMVMCTTNNAGAWSRSAITLCICPKLMGWLAGKRNAMPISLTLSVLSTCGSDKWALK